MKTDTELQQDVENTTKSEHVLGTAEIGIIVLKGIFFPTDRYLYMIIS